MIENDSDVACVWWLTRTTPRAGGVVAKERRRERVLANENNDAACVWWLTKTASPLIVAWRGPKLPSVLQQPRLKLPSFAPWPSSTFLPTLPHGDMTPPSAAVALSDLCCSARRIMSSARDWKGIADKCGAWI